MRIVWHYAATSELRVFELSYRLTGVTKVYDDVVEVQVQVWGAEWQVDVDRVTARLRFPGTW